MWSDLAVALLAGRSDWRPFVKMGVAVGRPRKVVCLFVASLIFLGSGSGGASASCRGDAAELVYRPLVNDSAQNPAYSADGLTLLFTVFHKGYNRGDAGVFTLQLQGGPRVPLLDETGQDAVNLPGSSWNATLDRVVLSSDREATDEIWTVAPDGTSLFRVTHQSPPFLHYQEPSFSPDGQWIVFEAVGDGPEFSLRGSLWKVRPDGTGLVLLVDGEATNTDNRQPNWSPAGDRIVFQRRSGDSEVWNVYTMLPDGGGITQLTSGRSDTDPAWSPDGQWVVYSSDFGGLPVSNLFAVPASGGTPVRITRGDLEEDSAPSWSPNGVWIAFESHPPDDRAAAALWRIRVPAPFGPCMPEGGRCDDANPCTTGDVCLAGVCSGAPSDGASCSDGNPCTQADTCQGGICIGDAAPLTQCRTPVASGRARVLLRDGGEGSRDRFMWKWNGEVATTKADFLDPLAATDYRLCIYDRRAGASDLVMATEIPHGGGWKERSWGFVYSDPRSRSDGIRKVVLKQGAGGSARVIVAGKGACLQMATLPLEQDPAGRVQLSNGVSCWEAVYSTSQVNDTRRFKAKSD